MSRRRMSPLFVHCLTIFAMGCSSDLEPAPAAVAGTTGVSAESGATSSGGAGNTSNAGSPGTGANTGGSAAMAGSEAMSGSGGAAATSGAESGGQGETGMGGTSPAGMNAAGEDAGEDSAGEDGGGTNTAGTAGDQAGTAGQQGVAGEEGVAGTDGGCSETDLRTGPPEGKEMFFADPIDDTFPFSLHWMGTFSDDPRYVSMTSLTDIDNDGDLDFASGQRHDLGGGMSWWEYCTPDHWVQHFVGTGHTSAAGGNATDVDGDGWVDLIAGDSWYRNPQNPRESEWDRFTIGAPGAEEVVVGDVTGNGRNEVLYVWRSIDPQWWAPGEDPTEPWNIGAQFQFRQQQGGAIGDIDGDGDNDILVGNEWWYRNVNGDGSQWENVNIAAGADFDSEPLANLGDFDGDGDIDLAMATHFGNRVAWVENLDGNGTDWELHILATNMNYLHAIVGADFDNDGDVDIFAGQNVGPQWMFENTDGAGNFEQHQIAEDARGHEARVGDVDCDGDLDIAGKPWGDPNEGGEANLTESRDHVYFKNELVERGGPAVFDRPAGEVWNPVQDPVCD